MWPDLTTSPLPRAVCWATGPPSLTIMSETQCPLTSVVNTSRAHEQIITLRRVHLSLCSVRGKPRRIVRLQRGTAEAASDLCRVKRFDARGMHCWKLGPPTNQPEREWRGRLVITNVWCCLLDTQNASTVERRQAL